MKRGKARPEITDQGRAFIEKARELGCDEDPARFEETLRRVARAKPKRELPPEDRPSQPKAGKKPPR